MVKIFTDLEEPEHKKVRIVAAENNITLPKALELIVKKSVFK